MAPRAYWTGSIRISLVGFGVRLYSVVSESDRIHLHLLHNTCHSRIKQPPVCPKHGQLDRSELVRGYEVAKDRYVIIEQKELDKIKLRSERTIDLTRFVKIAEVKDIYLNSSYYAAPDGKGGTEAYGVIRDAMEDLGVAGLGKLTMAGREYAALLRPEGRGFVLSTLHAGNEVRSPSAYFEGITKSVAKKDNAELARMLIERSIGKFDASQFHDTYQDALRKLVMSKSRGKAPVIVQEEDLPVAFDFASALRESIEGHVRKPPARSHASRRGASRRKAG